MKIAVDVMGTDYGPKELVLGAVNAVKAYGCETVLVGDEKIIKKLLVEYHADKDERITIHHASEVIEMQEHPAIAVKSKKDASIVVAARLLRNKECDALVSSGSTGAAVAAALFGVGRIKGVERPAYTQATFPKVISIVDVLRHAVHTLSRQVGNAGINAQVQMVGNGVRDLHIAACTKMPACLVVQDGFAIRYGL